MLAEQLTGLDITGHALCSSTANLQVLQVSMIALAVCLCVSSKIGYDK